MQTQYDYAKDNRTDDKYFSDVAIGQHNQQLGDNGIFLYALPKQYAIIKAKTILSEGCIIKSKRFLNKPVYQLQTDKINWIYWLHKPKFISYERTK